MGKWLSGTEHREEGGSVISFLALDDASYITGETLAISGGKGLD